MAICSQCGQEQSGQPQSCSNCGALFSNDQVNETSRTKNEDAFNQFDQYLDEAFDRFDKRLESAWENLEKRTNRAMDNFSIWARKFPLEHRIINLCKKTKMWWLSIKQWFAKHRNVIATMWPFVLLGLIMLFSLIMAHIFS